MINQNWIYLGLLIGSIGGIDYLIKTLKGEVRPNKVGWFLWSLAPLIASFAMLQQGVGVEMFFTFITGFIPFTIFLASFFNKKSYWKISSFDICVGGLSIVGLILWKVTNIGNVAIVFSIVADFLASLLTLAKSYREPESESYVAFALGTVSGIFALLVTKDWSFQNYAFNLYVTTINAILSLLIYFKLGPKLDLFISRYLNFKFLLNNWAAKDSSLKKRHE